MNYSRGRDSGGRRGYRALPLWAQWVIPFAVAAAVVIALVEFVNYETNDVSAIAGVTSPKAVREENREDTILVQQQQAPHVVKLESRPVACGTAIHAAVVGYMTHQINIGSMDGPIRSSSCARAGGTSSRQRLPLPGHRLRPAGDLSLLRGGRARLTRGHLLPARGAAGARA